MSPSIPTVSENWSGYAARSTNKFDAVRSVFVEPTITCPGVPGQVTSNWVGLDGLTDGTVEQDGTFAECAGPDYSTPVYYAWYEMYPAGSVNVFPVSPSDLMSASVTYAAGTFNLTIADMTTGASYTDSATCSECARSSAEWIIERPAYCNDSETKCDLSALADFGTSAMIDDVAGVDGGSLEPAASFENYALDMVDPLASGGFVSLDTVGALYGAADNFTATWDRAGTPTPITL